MKRSTDAPVDENKEGKKPKGAKNKGKVETPVPASVNDNTADAKTSSDIGSTHQKLESMTPIELCQKFTEILTKKGSEPADMITAAIEFAASFSDVPKVKHLTGSKVELKDLDLLGGEWTQKTLKIVGAETMKEGVDACAPPEKTATPTEGIDNPARHSKDLQQTATPVWKCSSVFPEFFAEIEKHHVMRELNEASDSFLATVLLTATMNAIENTDPKLGRAIVPEYSFTKVAIAEGVEVSLRADFLTAIYSTSVKKPSSYFDDHKSWTQGVIAALVAEVKHQGTLKGSYPQAVLETILVENDLREAGNEKAKARFIIITARMIVFGAIDTKNRNYYLSEGVDWSIANNDFTRFHQAVHYLADWMKAKFENGVIKSTCFEAV